MEPVVLKFTENTQFTDDELFEFCAANKELRIERDENGQIIIMPPTGSLSSSHNMTVASTLWNYNQRLKSGVVFDSSGGFRLPNGAMRAPDAAWIKKERWEQLSPEEQEKFAPLTPDFIIEVRSRTDSLKELQNKMQEWITNGCRLGWLIDPSEQKAYVYTPEGTPKMVASFAETLSGGDVLPGFQLNLSVLK
ncbi:MAG TPA: Uma2 family endonuclease [Flavisolibacter sp.]|nr:Uma2 family endonuclease [Flavisolibacter sp.]